MSDKNIFENSTVFSKHEYQEKAPKNAKKKKIVSIISVFLAVILLAGGVFLVSKIKTPEESDSSFDTSFEIINIDKENLEQVSIKTKQNEILFYKGKGEYSWFIKGVDPDLTIANDIYDLVIKSANIFAIGETENSDEEKLGFSSPFMEIAVKTKQNKDDYTLTVGVLTANEDGRYVKLNNSEKVYIVDASTFDEFSVDKFSFASKSVLSGVELSEEDEEDEKISKYFSSGLIQYFDSCSVSGGDMEYNLKLKHIEGSIYEMISPYKKRINPDTTIEFLSFLKYGLTAEGVYSFNQDNLADYGLDNPIKVSVTAADKFSAKLNIGKLQADGFYPVTSSGRKQIFKVSATEFEFLKKDIKDYFSMYLISDTVSEFSKVEVKCDGVNSVYTFLKKDEKDTEPKTKLNGKEIEFEQFRRLYKRVLGMNSTELVNGKEKADETVLTLVFDYNDEKIEQKTLSFKKYTGRRYLVLQNKKAIGIVSKTDVMNVINSAKALSLGNQISDFEI